MSNIGVKFIIKSERKLTKEQIDTTIEAMEKFKSGKSDIIVVPDCVSVLVMNENNEYITVL